MLPTILPFIKHLLLSTEGHGGIHHPRIRRGIQMNIVNLLIETSLNFIYEIYRLSIDGT